MVKWWTECLNQKALFYPIESHGPPGTPSFVERPVEVGVMSKDTVRHCATQVKEIVLR